LIRDLSSEGFRQKLAARVRQRSADRPELRQLGRMLGRKAVNRHAVHLKGGVLDWRERTDARTAASRFPIDLMDEMKLMN
jgi:hypothetical protein